MPHESYGRNTRRSTVEVLLAVGLLVIVVTASLLYLSYQL